MAHTPLEWLTAIRNTVQEEHDPFTDPLEGFNHDLKEVWLNYFLTGPCRGFYSHMEAFEHADTQILLQYPNLYQNWISSVFFYLQNRPVSEKTQKPKNLFKGFHLITLTIPNDITHDEGKKYLTEYIQEYFLGQIIKKPNSKVKKPKNPIETTYCFEIGSGNNLHAHLFVYHPKFKLSTHNSPLKAYKYNANVKFCDDLNSSLNRYYYISKIDKEGSKEFIFPNSELLKIIKENYSN